MLPFVLPPHCLCRAAVLLCVCAILAAGSPACAAKVDDAALKAALIEVLKENPDIVLDILKDNSEMVLEIAQQGNVLRKRKAMLAQWEQDAKIPKAINLENRVFRGNMDAPVTIVSYSDFTCPYCRQAEYVVGQLLKKYKGKVRVTFKALPKDDPFSLTAAKYSTAAFMMDPEKGWAFFDALFDGVEQFERDSETFLKDTAAKVGLDFRKLKAEAGSAAVQQRLDADRKEADGFGINGTPYFMVNDLLVRGAVAKDLFEEAIERALALKGKK